MLEIRPANTLTVPSFASRTVNLDVDLGALAIRYVFSTTITDSDPGSGRLRLSATQQDTALTVRADTLDINGVDVSGILDSFDDSTSATKGSLRIYKVSDPTKWLVFAVTAVASPSGYRNITVSNVGASATSPFDDGDTVLLNFTPAGEKGQDGVDGTPTPATRTAVSLIDSTTFKAAYLTEAGREGQFVWRAGDYSAQVTADPAQAIYIAPTSDATGASGAWVRDTEVVDPAMAGVLSSPNIAPSATYPVFSAGSGDQTAAMQAWLDGPGYKKIGRGRRTIRLDSGLIIPAANLDSRKLDFGNTVLDCSRFASTLVKAIVAEGVRGTQRSLAATASKGSYVISMTIANRAGLLPGMMVRIGSNKVFDAASTSARIGEINWIADASTNSVQLRKPLRDTYLVADSSFCEPIENPMPGLEILGGEFYGPEAVMNNVSGIQVLYADNPKVMGQQFHYLDYLGVSFHSCFKGEADIQMTKTRPNTTGYGVAYFDACLGGIARGTFRNVRHAASTNNSVSGSWGIPRDILFKEMDALYSAAALGGSMAGGAAFDAHTAAENISYVDCTSDGSTGSAISLECAGATIRNFKAFNSQSTVAAVLCNNKSDRAGTFNLDGILVDGSLGFGIRAQQGAGTGSVSVNLTNFDVRNTTFSAIYCPGVVGGSVVGGIVRPPSGESGVYFASASTRVTVGPYTCIGGTYSTRFTNDVTNSVIIAGADSSTSGPLLGSGTGNVLK